MGTHFFQDLVESEIKYLPLYPDDPGNFFNENFFNNSVNILPDLLPGYSAFSDTVKVIDIADSSGGNMLHILMNADEERAYAILSEPVLQNDFNFFKTGNFSSSSNPDFQTFPETPLDQH